MKYWIKFYAIFLLFFYGRRKHLIWYDGVVVGKEKSLWLGWFLFKRSHSINKTKRNKSFDWLCRMCYDCDVEKWRYKSRFKIFFLSFFFCFYWIKSTVCRCCCCCCCLTDLQSKIRFLSSGCMGASFVKKKKKKIELEPKRRCCCCCWVDFLLFDSEKFSKPLLMCRTKWTTLG